MQELPYLSKEALEQIRACGPQIEMEIARYWIETGLPDGYVLEDWYSDEIIAAAKQNIIDNPRWYNK